MHSCSTQAFMVLLLANMFNIYNLTLSTMRMTALFIAPLLAIMFYLFLKYKFPKQQHKVLVYAYIFGFLGILLVLGGQKIFGLLDFETSRNIKRATFFAFVVVGGLQELVKFLILRFYTVPKAVFKGANDGIVYSIMIGLGLSSSWLLWAYFFGGELYIKNDYELFMYAPSAFIFAIIMGFFVGLGKSRNNRFIDSMTGLLAASFFHGLFRFTYITNEYMLSILAAFATAVIAILLIFKAISMGMNKD